MPSGRDDREMWEMMKNRILIQIHFRWFVVSLPASRVQYIAVLVGSL